MTNKYNTEPFVILGEDNAPEKSVSYLAQAKAAFGLIPNVEGVMAQAPSLLASYMTAWDQFAETSFSPVEQQIIYLTANFENNCQYCTPWHSIIADGAGMPQVDIDALRNGGSLQNTKQEALRVFTRDVIRTQGSIAPADLKTFLDAGYNQQHALEVILGIAVKIMSNYTNSIAQTPLDKEAEGQIWTKPSLRG